MSSKILKTSEPLVYAQDIDETIVLDIRYATKNNFTKKVIYKSNDCFVHKDLVDPLKKVVKELKKYDLSIKIFDGFRPLWAQQILFDTFPDERYVANPNKITRHARGTAVDLTLINIKDQVELEMPTEFDSFSEKAHLVFEDLPKNVKENRKLLQEVMINSGFEPLAREWWHFDLKGWDKYPVLNIDLK